MLSTFFSSSVNPNWIFLLFRGCAPSIARILCLWFINLLCLQVLRFMDLLFCPWLSSGGWHKKHEASSISRVRRQRALLPPPVVGA
uniref:Uncharacterized protein n=1 Tax=Manihot esculenta TaxID=3983 RepID=A0A2C9UP31_MANES